MTAHDEVEEPDRRAERGAEAREQDRPADPVPVGRFGAQPEEQADERQSNDERQPVDVDRLEQPEEEAGREGGSPVAQGASIAEQPCRAEQQHLHRDLGSAVAENDTCGISNPRHSTAPSAAIG